MIVKEIIERLQKYNENSEVKFRFSNEDKLEATIENLDNISSGFSNLYFTLELKPREIFADEYGKYRKQMIKIQDKLEKDRENVNLILEFMKVSGVMRSLREFNSVDDMLNYNVRGK